MLFSHPAISTKMILSTRSFFTWHFRDFFFFYLLYFLILHNVSVNTNYWFNFFALEILLVHLILCSIFNFVPFISLKMFYVIVGLAGIFGNTLVMYVVLRYSKMQTTTNRYILNLALADGLYLLGKNLEDFLNYLPYAYLSKMDSIIRANRDKIHCLGIQQYYRSSISNEKFAFAELIFCFWTKMLYILHRRWISGCRICRAFYFYVILLIQFSYSRIGLKKNIYPKTFSEINLKKTFWIRSCFFFKLKNSNNNSNSKQPQITNKE